MKPASCLVGGTADLGFAVFFKNALADNVKHSVKSVLLENPLQASARSC
jgi:hypothetical protein